MNNNEEYVKIICKNLADENGFNDKYGLLEGKKIEDHRIKCVKDIRLLFLYRMR